MNLNSSARESVLINGELAAAAAMQAVPTGEAVAYEVIRVMDGVPLFIEAHLERLNLTLELAGFTHRLDNHAVKQGIDRLRETCGVRSQNLRINAWCTGDAMTWTAFFVESSYPEPEAYAHGVDTGLLRMQRHNPGAKVWQAELKDAAAQACGERNLHEVILVDPEGYVSEGSRSNLFFTQGDTLVTAEDGAVLGGITRLMLISLLEAGGISLVKRRIHESELHRFDGAFLTGTSIHLLPIRRIDAQEYASPGQPLIKRLMMQFNEAVSDYQTQYLIKPIP